MVHTVRIIRFFGQDKVRKSQDFGFQNLRKNPVILLRLSWIHTNWSLPCTVIHTQVLCMHPWPACVSSRSWCISSHYVHKYYACIPLKFISNLFLNQYLSFQNYYNLATRYEFLNAITLKLNNIFHNRFYAICSAEIKKQIDTDMSF